MLETLLVPVDGSPAALTAARLATRLAGPGGRLTLAHVIEPGDVVPFLGFPDQAASASLGLLLDQQQKDAEVAGRTLLEDTRRLIGRDEAALELLAGRPVDAVLDVLDRFDGCVVGSRGRGTLARVLLGSVSDGILRHATRPVAIARREDVTRILVATDGSDHANRAAAVGGELARRLGVPLSLVAATDFPIETYLDGRAELEGILRSAAAAAFATAREAARMDELSAPGELSFHEPVHGILEHAGRIGADLVVVGRRGRGRSLRALLGSVSQRLALNAEVSVLVVP